MPEGNPRKTETKERLPLQDSDQPPAIRDPEPVIREEDADGADVPHTEEYASLPNDPDEDPAPCLGPTHSVTWPIVTGVIVLLQLTLLVGILFGQPRVVDGALGLVNEVIFFALGLLAKVLADHLRDRRRR